MHGLSLKNWVKWAFLALYVVGAVFVYTGRGVNPLWELSAIPLIDYPAVIVLALLIGLIVRVTGWRRSTGKLVAN